MIHGLTTVRTASIALLDRLSRTIQQHPKRITAAVAALLLTGGGEGGPQVINSLIGREGAVRTDAWPRFSERFLGAGTTLAAAAAAALAHGMDLPEAVREAQEFTQQTLRHAYRAGMGRALPDRFFWARGKGSSDD